MATYAFLVDITRCLGCQACVVACKTGNELPAGLQYTRITEKTSGKFPKLSGWFDNDRCLHCADAECVEVCPVNALYKEDGMTRLDRSVCIGCGLCVDACPFGVPEMVDERAAKCDGCAAVVKAGGKPWCVKTCPSNALMYGEREEILAEAKRRLETAKSRYAKASIFGEREEGGLGVIMVLPDRARKLDIVANPVRPTAAVVQDYAAPPARLGFAGLSLVVGMLGALIQRRNRLRDSSHVDSSHVDT